MNVKVGDPQLLFAQIARLVLRSSDPIDKLLEFRPECHVGRSSHNPIGERDTADHQNCHARGNVRYWHIADIDADPEHVRSWG